MYVCMHVYIVALCALNVSNEVCIHLNYLLMTANSDSVKSMEAVIFNQTSPSSPSLKADIYLIYVEVVSGLF